MYVDQRNNEHVLHSGAPRSAQIVQACLSRRIAYGVAATEAQGRARGGCRRDSPCLLQAALLASDRGGYVGRMRATDR